MQRNIDLLRRSRWVWTIFSLADYFIYVESEERQQDNRREISEKSNPEAIQSYQIHMEKLKSMKPIMKIAPPEQPKFVYTKPKQEMSKRGTKGLMETA